MSSYYLFTEIANCGKIGKIALKSFHKSHDIKVHIYGTKKDFEWIEDHPNNVFHELSLDVINGYKNGHEGTALLWSQLIMNRPEKYLIHFDSDDIFRGDIINDIINLIQANYDLIGATRNYKNNPQNMDIIRHLSDVVSTNCFAFNKDKIDKFDYYLLHRMVLGAYNPLGHITLDFFDPVSFNILKNGGSIVNLDFDDVGGCNKAGSRDNIFKDINNESTPFKIEFGRKLAHFSGVGSGMHFYEDPTVNVPESYKSYCIDRYALFCKIFYGEDIGIDVSNYKNILSIKEWF